MRDQKTAQSRPARLVGAATLVLSHSAGLVEVVVCTAPTRDVHWRGITIPDTVCLELQSIVLVDKRSTGPF